MIKESDVFKIGKFTKPHGVKGEIAFAFDNDVFDRVDCPYLICKIDGILVPFFVASHRFKGKETALITFEGIKSEDKAQRFTKLDVYFPRSYFEEKDDDNNDNSDIEYSWKFFLGFTVIDEKSGELGVIEDIDESTINTLFIIENEETEYLIPATEEFIIKIDAKKKILYTKLVDGLID